MGKTERRTYAREDLNWDVTFAHPRRGSLRGQLRNYSNGGMYIALPESGEPPHGVVSLRIYRDDVMLMVRGRVIHSDADGLGVIVNEPVTVVELYNGTVYEVAPHAALVSC